jgi:hypothetical protein
MTTNVHGFVLPSSSSIKSNHEPFCKFMAVGQTPPHCSAAVAFADVFHESDARHLVFGAAIFRQNFWYSLAFPQHGD